jgi:hypothetical protein
MQWPHLHELVQMLGLLAQQRREIADVGNGVVVGIDAPLQATVTSPQDDVPALPPWDILAASPEDVVGSIARCNIFGFPHDPG